MIAFLVSSYFKSCKKLKWSSPHHHQPDDVLSSWHDEKSIERFFFLLRQLFDLNCKLFCGIFREFFKFAMYTLEWIKIQAKTFTTDSLKLQPCCRFRLKFIINSAKFNYQHSRTHSTTGWSGRRDAKTKKIIVKNRLCGLRADAYLTDTCDYCVVFDMRRSRTEREIKN